MRKTVVTRLGCISVLVCVTGVGCSGDDDNQSSIADASGAGRASTGGKSSLIVNSTVVTIPSAGATSTVPGGGVSANTAGVGGVSTTEDPVGGATTGGTNSGGNTTVETSNGGATTGGTSTRGAGGNWTTSTGGIGVAGTSVDGCSDSLAQGITLSEIAVFQTGKITVMKSGVEVPARSANGGQIIEGRQTLFRVYVTTDGGFESRQLSARLTLNGASTPYFEKRLISESSSEFLSNNSFQILVPESEIKSGLNYSVSVVECETSPGLPHDGRFPAKGVATLATRRTGEIKIVAIPVVANGITPDLTAVTARLKRHIEAQYPTTSVQMKVDSTPLTGCGIVPAKAEDSTVWSSCLSLVADRRASDKPADDVYYVGLATPAATYADYCGLECVSGVGYVSESVDSASTRALVAVGYPDGLDTITHELGHNHGLKHSPGCYAADVDKAYPYVLDGKGYIGWVGWNSEEPERFLDPAVYTDLMGYCETVWVSDYIYAKLTDRVAALNGSFYRHAAVATSTWRVLHVTGRDARWGVSLTEPTAALGMEERATVYDEERNPLVEVSVYRTDDSNGTGGRYLVPEPSTGWASINVGSIRIHF